MSDVSPGASEAEPVRSAAKMAGVDLYALRARILPAILATAPLIALGVLALPLLEGAQKFWSVTSLAVPAYVTLLSRRAGNRIEGDLYELWGGAPTTQRLRFASTTSPEEITRRHERIRLILGDERELPNLEAEQAHPEESDRRYVDSVRRIRAKVRNHPQFELLNLENRNYGFARNLFGLKILGLACAWFGLVTSVGIGLTLMIRDRGPADAAVALLPFLVSVGALLAWRMVDSDYVRPCADAYADAVIEALDLLPDASRTS